MSLSKQRSFVNLLKTPLRINESMIDALWRNLGGTFFVREQEQGFTAARAVRLAQRAARILARLKQQSISPICVAVAGKFVGVRGLANPIRPEAGAIVRAIRDREVREIVI